MTTSRLLRLVALVALLALLGLTAGCGDAKPPAAPAAASDDAAPEAPATDAMASVPDPVVLRQTALRLAGLVDAPAPDGAPQLPRLASGTAWARHAELLDATWSEIESRHLQAIRDWSARELADLEAPQAPLVYPFGGPDVVNAVEFFPHASTYVLVGLEAPGQVLLQPAGSGDSELQAADAALAADLERLRGALDSVVESGYFVTKRMESDLAGGAQLDGVLPLLLLFLARTGHVPTGAAYVELAADGTVGASPSAAAPTAVRIDFDGGELYFFSLNLANEPLQSDDRFLRFLAGLGGYNVYLKSASYLLHMAEFSLLREELLAHAVAVLQDDSGLPLRFFPPDTWELSFYGTYTTTLPAYREWFQEDLRQAYAERGDVQPLAFSLGYNSKIGGSCLILAQRRRPAEA